jgi:hypothetical protein
LIRNLAAYAPALRCFSELFLCFGSYALRTGAETFE